VLLSLVYRLLRCLFGLLAVLVGSGLSKDAELLMLRHENQVLRSSAASTRSLRNTRTATPSTRHVSR
jgi:hypothetical protein